VVTIPVATSDSVVWDIETVITDICHAITNNNDIIIDLLSEGPCCTELGLYNILENCCNTFNYDIRRIVILTANASETHSSITIKYKFPRHLVINATSVYSDTHVTKELTKHFGVFIGKSNPARLHLSSYLYHVYPDLTIQTYRYNKDDDYYRDNIGLELLIKNYKLDAVDESSFLSECPFLLEDTSEIEYDKNSELNLSQQLNKSNKISKHYTSFFVELVCESYYSGNTFFPTEKIWRPMLLKTPFIVQGPLHYLRNLHELGFKTFDNWWDEGYDIDPDLGRLDTIRNNIDWIAGQDICTIKRWHNEMTEILEHNYNRVNYLMDNRTCITTQV
jgi:hypothetical protein